jgi:hypothetical protein
MKWTNHIISRCIHSIYEANSRFVSEMGQMTFPHTGVHTIFYLVGHIIKSLTKFSKPHICVYRYKTAIIHIHGVIQELKNNGTKITSKRFSFYWHYFNRCIIKFHTPLYVVQWQCPVNTSKLQESRKAKQFCEN